MPSEAANNRFTAVASVAAIASSVAIAVIGFEFTNTVVRIEVLEDANHRIISRVAVFDRFIAAQDKYHEYWAAVVKDIRGKTHKNEVAVARIRSGDDKEADRFTGKQGAELKGRIRNLEKKSWEIEKECCQKSQ